MGCPLLLSPFEELPQSGLGDGSGQVPAVENLHLGHCVLVRSLQRVGPVHDDVTVPSLDLSAAKTPGEEAIMVESTVESSNLPFSMAGSLVGLVLQETKPAVVGLLVRIGINDDIHQTS